MQGGKDRNCLDEPHSVQHGAGMGCHHYTGRSGTPDKQGNNRLRPVRRCDQTSVGDPRPGLRSPGIRITKAGAPARAARPSRDLGGSPSPSGLACPGQGLQNAEHSEENWRRSNSGNHRLPLCTVRPLLPQRVVMLATRPRRLLGQCGPELLFLTGGSSTLREGRSLGARRPTWGVRVLRFQRLLRPHAMGPHHRGGQELRIPAGTTGHGHVGALRTSCPRRGGRGGCANFPQPLHDRGMFRGRRFGTIPPLRPPAASTRQVPPSCH